jgi:hypothetical protein
MSISPFFRNLRTAYLAELDDLRSDSEGQDVLRRRLADKRKELDFLVQMIEISPEMVAVVFHQAFTFKHPAVMDDLLSQEGDDLPDWDALAPSLGIAAWAIKLIETVRRAPMGDWFLAVAAGLEYLATHPGAGRGLGGSDDDEDGEGERENGDDADMDANMARDRDQEADARASKEAGENWLAEQGFDRKD